jgi:hypothetical protein
MQDSNGLAKTPAWKTEAGCRGLEIREGAFLHEAMRYVAFLTI